LEYWREGILFRTSAGDSPTQHPLKVEESASSGYLGATNIKAPRTVLGIYPPHTTSIVLAHARVESAVDLVVVRSGRLWKSGKVTSRANTAARQIEDLLLLFCAADAVAYHCRCWCWWRWWVICCVGTDAFRHTPIPA